MVLAIHNRFFGFIWWGFWSVLVTGCFLMLLSPRFLWFDYSTLWSKLLAVKQIAFLLLGFFSWQTVKVFAKMEKSAEAGGEVFEGWRLSYLRLVRRAIFSGIISFLCSAGMATV